MRQTKSAAGTGREQQLKGFNPKLLQGLVFVNCKVLQGPGQHLVDVEQHALLADPRGPRRGRRGGTFGEFERVPRLDLAIE